MEVIWLDSCGAEGDVVTSCDDGDLCTIDACDPTTSFCVHVPDGSCQTEEPCLDAPVQICQDGTLLWLDACGQLAGVADPCADDDPCTIDGCDDETLSCSHTSAQTADCTGETPVEDGCDQGAYLDCFAGGLVWVNACGEQKGIAKLCDDGDPCTVDGCDPALVACTYGPSASADCGKPDPGADTDADVGGGAEGGDLSGPNDDATGGDGGEDVSGPVNGAEIDGGVDDVSGPIGRPVSGGDGCSSTGDGREAGVLLLLLGLAGMGYGRRRRTAERGLSAAAAAVAVGLVALAAAGPADAASPCGNVPASPWVKYATDCYETTDNGWDYESRAFGAPDGDGGTFCDACGKSGTGYTYLLSCGGWSYCDPPNVDTITSVTVGVYVKGATSNTMKLSVGAKSKTFTQGSTFGWEELDVTSLESTWTWDKVNALQAKVAWVSGTTTAQYAVNAFRVVVTYTNCTPNASSYCNGAEIRWKDSCGNDGGVKQSCDDGNGCTVDACVGGGSCSNTPVANTGTTCHSGNVHYTDSCGNIGGLVGSCDDGIPCTVDSCANSLCYHAAQPNTGQTCHNGNVHYADSCGGIGAMVKACDDGNGCTTDGCTASSCYNNPTPDTQKVCFENDPYYADSCGNRAAKLAECDDGDPCTIDACDAAGGTCQHTEDEVICPKPCVDPPVAKCFDNNVILVDCKNNTVGTQSCNDDDGCTLDGCVDGACKHDPVTTTCACNPAITTTCVANDLVQIDACGNVKGTLESCDDGDPCTIDACDDEAVLCQHTPKDCPADCKPDGFVCQGNKRFAIDTCKNLTEADDCDDGDACTIDACSVSECTHVPSNDPSCVCGDVVSKACEGNLVMGIDKCGNKIEVVENCNDGNECTVDGCAGGACSHTPILVAPCGCASSSTVICDANTLVTKDACGNVTGTVACNDGDPCTVDACDAEAGVCQHDDQCCDASHELGAACQDGVLMLTDSCGNVLEVKAVCDDGDECTTDSCEVDTCVYDAPGGKYVSQLCGDEGDLYWVDGCGRISELAEECDDGKACTTDSCDAGLGACVHLPSEGDTTCCEPETDQVCVEGNVHWRDSCNNIGNLTETCLDGDVCTQDSCALGACVTTPAPLPECPPCAPHAATACLGDAVVWVDGCDTLGEIIAGCDDADPCTVDTCDAKSAKCVHIPSAGCTPVCEPESEPICLDGHLMWVDSCGKAQGLATNCEDGNPCTVDGCPAGGDACSHVPAESKECGCGAPAKTFCNGTDIVWLDGCGEEVAVAMACDDDNPCTDNGCNVVTTLCEYLPSSDCPGPEDDLGPVQNPEGDEPGADASNGDTSGDDGALDGDNVSGPGDGGDTATTAEFEVNGDVVAGSGDDLSPSIFVSGGADSGCSVGTPKAPWVFGLWLLLGGLVRAYRRRAR
ncbi:MAG: hypothetical protein IV100_25270 [Myxococcales bacterium]|nr:hypothetical protein [Myxococcales bacterium]